MSDEKLRFLMDRRAELDAMIEQHGMVLKSNNIGMHDPLVDSQGFPLPNVDQFCVRQARQSIICLQNDRKWLMQAIDNEMAVLFEQKRNDAGLIPTQQHPLVEPMEVDNPINELEPFAVVLNVEPGQLAERVGIQTGDMILQIGTLTAKNFKFLSQIQNILEQARGQIIRCVIRKEATGNDVNLELDFRTGEIRMGITAKGV
ncbi:26S proteasome non-ATPase regulatory subunit 9 [Anopheles maculipalpis]|uniref:26S proteasome non-ATPase regulatory subunit 9 n=1 Tax=Anopheles maculipalpis TaxID=1496333 RepID=UPI002158D100|nr:26S proteasome non-ATPase regulatory subunit 9 [Anopheles maculipalpis]